MREKKKKSVMKILKVTKLYYNIIKLYKIIIEIYIRATFKESKEFNNLNYLVNLIFNF